MPVDPSGQLAAPERTCACAQASHKADGAPQDQAWRGGFATGATSLMMTGGTKELFQTVVGPRQIGHVITVKQAWPVAPGDLQEVLENASDLPVRLAFRLMRRSRSR